MWIYLDLGAHIDSIGTIVHLRELYVPPNMESDPHLNHLRMHYDLCFGVSIQDDNDRAWDNPSLLQNKSREAHRPAEEA